MGWWLVAVVVVVAYRVLVVLAAWVVLPEMAAWVEAVALPGVPASAFR